jgi:thioesterase domain-containing protein
MDSLRLARCALGLSRALHVACRPDDILAHPSCSALASLLHDRRRVGGGWAADRPSRERLLALNANVGRTPVVCIHPSGGQVTAYLRLASLLGDRPVFAIPSRALADPETEHPTIAAMAADYADVIEARRLATVALVGWSMGGIVAHAVAEALEARGRVVALVALIDPVVLDDRDPSDEADRRFAERALDQEPAGDAGDREKRVALYRRHFALVRGHRPGKVSAPVHVWWAAGGTTDRWTTHTRQDASERVVGGSHFTIVLPPYVEVIARDLSGIGTATPD